MGIDPWRLLAASVLTVLMTLATVSISSAQEPPVDPIYFTDCELTISGCGPWLQEGYTIYLPGFPNCPISVIYYTRECPNPAGGFLKLREFRLKEVYWPTATPGMPDPCSSFNTYIHRGGAGQFPANYRDLFQDLLVEMNKQVFNKEYQFDSIQALLNPTDPQEVGEYEERKCINGTGGKTIRAVQGVCMAAIVSEVDCQPAPFLRTLFDDKGLNTAEDPDPLPQPRCKKIRYVPCDVEGPCCIETIRVCRIPHLGVTATTRTTTSVGDGECNEGGPPDGLTLLPGETLIGCTDYCQQQSMENHLMDDLELSRIMVPPSTPSDSASSAVAPSASAHQHP